ncbi:uncharacterized protein PHACADRAFT_193460 [Phanerochaete carnosa HHB-10118-sp]|uniref:PIN domain-like protein n=1 Tax=Phanerochaete carnosa (strain HHB-10118-sp) TaxID=650164 RepID=K5W3B3_PHACS|nr:uncharacterized protein PHACADRAFT_193460 [Phanerochaete carnosa HHB-10118-sp]EKM58338.1 hypothetical protein PHACADRAFT_193460 [Phanerochaete carnosa HHB-10118-sp]
MGVKSLWSLLEPVGRPVPLETMEGKAMAIDSSIWIYQFQATMRDKEGRGLVNAHVLGFLRRISKLLFYGIKPVFVFDGGAPALKRTTISERKNKKSGAAASHAKVAERLLAAHMRREAVSQAQKVQGFKSKAGGPVILDENTVYLEDLENPQPAKPQTPAKQTSMPTEQSPPSSKKNSRWHDHDPYRLPDVNMNEMIANATRSVAPDPRLATEEELRSFIEEMRPDDFDVSSLAFRELPTEVQYEIIGDLRLKSRQTSYKRLQNMLKNAKTPMDFSKEQIKNLKQRNSLTQQLLTTTDSIGKAHVEIPIRIASERNKQYILVKNEGEGGGWVLGVRDEGTRAKPIEIDQDEPAPQKQEVGAKRALDDAGEDSDMDMEEVPISVGAAVDPDLREYRRRQALSALSKRYSPKKLTPLTTKPPRKDSKPLFAPEDGEAGQAPSDDEMDPELVSAIQESLIDEEARELERAIVASRADSSRSRHIHDIPGSNVGASSSRSTLDSALPQTPRAGSSSHDLQLLEDMRDSDDELYASPTRLETALSIANAGPKKPSPPQRKSASQRFLHDFGMPTLLLSEEQQQVQAHPVSRTLDDSGSEDDDMVKVPLQASPLRFSSGAPAVEHSLAAISTRDVSPASPVMEANRIPESLSSDEDEEMEEILPQVYDSPSTHHLNASLTASAAAVTSSTTEVFVAEAVVAASSQHSRASLHSVISVSNRRATVTVDESKNRFYEAPPPVPDTSLSPNNSSSPESDGEPWSRPLSPSDDPAAEVPQKEKADEDWDAAQEIDPHVEESEYAQFVSQMRGRNLDEVRKEIDDEIRALKEQRKIAMRDSEDITHQMISQVMHGAEMMLRLFGIPYITAPMEAEAQCAELLALGLVDGIITDDSDVFLFGGARVLKNMFNQSKTVECFLLSDLGRELGLEREKLIRLAYLLGSDYTEGLPGVGPVVAMELLTEFSGSDGLHKFREWWRKVQSGRDTLEDNKSKFRKRFKKRFKELYLPEDWPNPTVRDAYYHPTVDSSEEPFKWGLPDLDALRQFFNAELGWAQEKVDDLLLPVIHKMGKRNQAGNTNRQGNLNTFFDVPTGAGAPRKRQAYASKRLQQVVADFRKQAQLRPSSPLENASENEYEEGEEARPKKKQKPSRKLDPTRSSGTVRGKRGRGRGRSGGTSALRKKKGQELSGSESDSSSEGVPLAQPVEPAAQAPNLRPRPRPAYKQAILEGDEHNDTG